PPPMESSSHQRKIAAQFCRELLAMTAVEAVTCKTWRCDLRQRQCISKLQASPRLAMMSSGILRRISAKLLRNFVASSSQ
ncbi:hypothetical protein, partial [Bradyrhizobium cytisi]|uniref:hypothetical protein n=1 Tax=Bradyrhizobium cytisi TaxID=515489 RepID=UPI001AED492C